MALTAGSDSPRSGAIVVANGRAFALIDRTRDLGPVLHRVLRRGVDALTVLAEPDVAPDLARRSALIDFEIEVRSVEGADAVEAAPRSAPAVPDLADAMWRVAAAAADAGARVVDDHGRLVAEVLGLEVARLEDPLAVTGVDSVADRLAPQDRYRFRIGVGEADRDLHDYLQEPETPGREDHDRRKLERVVSLVSARRLDPAHPLSRLARPRWLRSVLLDDPGLIDLVELEAVAPLVAKPGIFDREPSAAFGRLDRTTVVCSNGVDPDLLPEAADYRHRLDPGSRLLVVVPHRDLAMTGGPLAPLIRDCEIRAVDAPWETIG